MGYHVKLLRKSLDLNQREFALKCDISQSYLSEMESGKKPVTEDVERKLFDALGKDMVLSFYCDDDDSMNMYTAPVESSSSSVPTVPHIPLEVAAGYTSGLANAVMLADCEQRPIIPLFRSYDLTMTVSGHSMEPAFEAGDMVALRKVEADALRWGEVYVVSSTDGAVMKRVYDDGENLRLVSYNPDFPPYPLAKSKVLDIYKVVGMIRAF